MALGCAIKHTQQLNRELIDEGQDVVISWAKAFPECYGISGGPVRLNCNAPLLNIEDDDKWRTSRGLRSSWNHASLTTKEVALRHLAIHIVDHVVRLDDKV